MQNPVTMKMIADKLGLSKSAVSKALNGYPDINENTRYDVVMTAKKMGYSLDFFEKNIVISPPNTIGVIVKSMGSIYGEFFNKINEKAREKGLLAILCDYNRDLELQQKYVQLMVDAKVKGLLIAPENSDISKIKDTVGSKMPVVYFGDRVADETESVICSDCRKGTELAIEYLVSLGHKKIAIACDVMVDAARIKIEAYQGIMAKYGFHDHILEYRGSKKGLVEKGYELGREMIDEGLNCTAVYCIKDYVAFGLMEAMKDAGVRIPEDISVIGYDGTEGASFPLVQLTTIQQDKTSSAETMIQMLIEKDVHPENSSPKHCLIMPKLVIRKSCRSIDETGKKR